MKSRFNLVLGLVLLSLAIYLYYYDNANKFSIIFSFFAGHFLCRCSISKSPNRTS